MKMSLKEFTKECVRVLKITKKPTKDEFKGIFKVAGLGVLAIGLIGFVIQLIKSLFF
jgi:protein transport protein SEC61 subunit gamma-like protein